METQATEAIVRRKQLCKHFSSFIIVLHAQWYFSCGISFMFPFIYNCYNLSIIITLLCPN